MKNKLFKVKPINEILRVTKAAGGLKRSLTALNLVSLGVGGVVGAGILVFTGPVAAEHTGPAVVISLIIAGVVCGLTALCYAELTSMIPISGSAYTYAYATMGELVAWIIGWDLILEYLMGAATLAVAWSGYAQSLLSQLGYALPAYLANAPISDEGQWTGAWINVPAVLIIVILTHLLARGTRESLWLNNLMVTIKLSVIIIFIVLGFMHMNVDNLQPFIPENTGEFGRYGWSGIFRGAAIMFFAYLGFDALSTTAQEAKNPQRDMPLAIMTALFIAVGLYILVAIALTGMVHYTALEVPDPLAVAIDAIQGSSQSFIFWLNVVIKLGILAGLLTVILILLLAQPRIFYSMGLDGLLPPRFMKLHKRYRTPYQSTLTTGYVAAVLAALFPIHVLEEMVSVGTLLAFLFVSIGVLVLRYTRPNLVRPFKVPLGPVIPALATLSTLFMMTNFPLSTWFRLLGWMLIGLVIYFSYGIKYSHLQRDSK